MRSPSALWSGRATPTQWRKAFRCPCQSPWKTRCPWGMRSSLAWEARTAWRWGLMKPLQKQLAKQRPCCFPKRQCLASW